MARLGDFDDGGGTDAWALDPLGDEGGGRIAVARVGLVRIACVAAEAGARMQREGLAADPVGWMLEPLALFGGRPAIEACLGREECSRAILLHGLGLGLDADPAFIDRLLGSDQTPSIAERCHA